MIARRSFLLGLGSTLAAPAVIRTPGLLMPVREILLPPIVLHVSAQHGAIDSDGSRARPFATIDAAARAAARLGSARQMITINVQHGLYVPELPVVVDGLQAYGATVVLPKRSRVGRLGAYLGSTVLHA